VVTAEAPLNTGDAFDPDVILEFHRRAWREWARILELSQGPQREMGLINIPIGQSKIPELKQRIRQFQDEIIGWLEAEKDPDSMVQLGVVMVPVTK
jgi:hypothetical protein